jgi:hypothetical protein
MMHARDVLVELPKDRRPEVDCFGLAAKEAKRGAFHLLEALFQEECTPPLWNPPVRQTLVYRS